MQFKKERASAIVIKDNKVLLIHRILPDQEYWTFPGGGIESGELEDAAVTREVLEETGLSVLSCHKVFEDIDAKIDRLNHFYVCETNDLQLVLGGPEALRQSDNNKHIPEWVSIDNIPQLKLVPSSAKEKFLEYINKK